MLVKIYNRKALDPDEVVADLLEQAEGFKHRIADARLLLNEALEAGETVLLEGSQGTLLDVDHGTYPYVTSSNPTAGGAAVGSGIGPTRITTVLGILKAYTTRVGSGPFPTELFDEFGAYLSKTGGEVGVTTGRPRRCGWFDAVIARYATRVNGITDYFLTKLDVLSSLETVPVCVGYTVDGKRTDEMPMTQSDIARAEPVYEELPGWWEDISDAREFDDLPAKARDYVCGWKSLPERMFRASASVRAATRRSCAATSWRPCDAIPPTVDPEYDRHGGFPVFEAASPGRVSRRSWRRCAACRTSRCRPTRTATPGSRRRPASPNWSRCSSRSRRAEGVGPAGRMPRCPVRATC